MAEKDESFNNGDRETDGEMICGMTSTPTQVLSEQEGLCVSLPSIPPQQFPRPSHENTFGCCAQNDQS